MGIELQNINKQFGEYKAIDNLSLNIASGELIALLGPSGCGKTTLLRIIAGLELADSGKILLENKDTTNLPPRKKNVGFVFQHYALFRRLTVFENVAFGLKVLPFRERPSRSEIPARMLSFLFGPLKWLVPCSSSAYRYAGHRAVTVADTLQGKSHEEK